MYRDTPEAIELREHELRRVLANVERSLGWLLTQTHPAVVKHTDAGQRAVQHLAEARDVLALHMAAWNQDQ